MHRGVLFLLVVLSFLSTHWCFAEQTEITIAAGENTAGEVLAIAHTFTNPLPHPLLIEAFAVSCTCQGVTADKQKLGIGDSVAVRIRIDTTTMQPGRMALSFALIGRDMGTGEKHVFPMKITGTLLSSDRPAIAYPDSIRRRGLFPNQRFVTTAKIEFPSCVDVSELEAVPSMDWIEASISETLRRQNRLTVDVTVTVPDTWDDKLEHVALVGANGKSVFDLPIQIHMADALVLEREVLTLDSHVESRVFFLNLRVAPGYTPRLVNYTFLSDSLLLRECGMLESAPATLRIHIERIPKNPENTCAFGTLTLWFDDLPRGQTLRVVEHDSTQ